MKWSFPVLKCLRASSSLKGGKLERAPEAPIENARQPNDDVVSASQRRLFLGMDGAQAPPHRHSQAIGGFAYRFDPLIISLQYHMTSAQRTTPLYLSLSAFMAYQNRYRGFFDSPSKTEMEHILIAIMVSSSPMRGAAARSRNITFCNASRLLAQFAISAAMPA